MQGIRKLSFRHSPMPMSSLWINLTTHGYGTHSRGIVETYLSVVNAEAWKLWEVRFVTRTIHYFSAEGEQPMKMDTKSN